MGLLTSILTSPVKGLEFVFKQIRDNVDRELYDETIWQQKLLDLQMSYEMGDIDEAAYQAEEDMIVAQLDLINAMYFDDSAEEDDEEEDYIEEPFDEVPDQGHLAPEIQIVPGHDYTISN